MVICFWNFPVQETFAENFSELYMGSLRMSPDQDNTVVYFTVIKTVFGENTSDGEEGKGVSVVVGVGSFLPD